MNELKKNEEYKKLADRGKKIAWAEEFFRGLGGLPFNYEDDRIIVAEYLENCIVEGSFERTLEFITPLEGYTGPLMHRYFVSCATIYAALSDKKKALHFVKEARLFGGYEAVKNLQNDIRFKFLLNNKTFRKYTNEATPIDFIKEDLREIMKMWRKDEYDNYKDAILDANDLVTRIPPSESKLLQVAKNHREQVLKTCRDLAVDDKVMAEYLKGLF